MNPPPVRILKRLIAVARHFTPEIWPWEGELWRQRIHHHHSFYYLGESLLMQPFPADLPKKERSRLLEAVGKYLAPLSTDPDCREKPQVWRNLRYSPPSPIGSYLWECTAEFLLSLRKANPPLFEGWKAYANDRGRDGCPYTDPVRDSEWDTGFMLAGGYKYHRPKLMDWLKYHEARIAAGEPAFPPYQPIPASEN